MKRAVILAVILGAASSAVAVWTMQFAEGSIGSVDGNADAGALVLSAPLEGWPARQGVARRRLSQLNVGVRRCDTSGCWEIAHVTSAVTLAQSNTSEPFHAPEGHILVSLQCPLVETRVGANGIIATRPIQSLRDHELYMRNYFPIGHVEVRSAAPEAACAS